MSDANCYGPLGLALFIADRSQVSLYCRDLLLTAQSYGGVSLRQYFTTFFLTCFLESPIYMWALRRARVSLSRSVFIILLLNLATHPLVYFFFPWAFTKLELSYYQMLAWAELFAFSVEAILLYRLVPLNFRKAVGVSLLANLFSWGFGIYF